VFIDDEQCDNLNTGGFMYKNNDLIYDAIEHLNKSTGADIEVHSNRNDYDAMVSINGVQFVVYAKSELRASNKSTVIADKENIKTSKPIIVIAKYIAKEVAEELRNKDINYLDGAGNCFIKHKSVFFFVTGQKLDRISKTNQARAFQEAGLKLIFNLLSSQESLQYSYRKLAEIAGISIGSVSNVMNELEELNFILKTKEKRVLKNSKSLLDRWVISYHDILKPRMLRKRMRFINENNTSWNSLKLKDNDELTLWGGEPAASIITEQLSPKIFTIYSNENWKSLAKNLLMIPDENGNVEIYSIFWKENDCRINNYRNHYVAPVVIVYADLVTSGSDRNLEIAKRILSDELQYIK